ALLDQLHGKSAPGLAPAPATPPPAPKPVTAAKPVVAKPAAPAPVAAKAEAETVRVETQKLDQLMNLVGELVLVRNRLKAMKSELGECAMRSVSELDVITRSLQNTVAQV